ncbi:unnamed protein product [Ceutorhynchus assimilis]|uniref:Uncharacterized protein n=1 Tax=Ceutorhynchus assimilis TaxID=467358 RepID=A0A9N9MQA9_9CUCU|nr:unnamed protein product [Ceutorhynchus assimilis]
MDPPACVQNAMMTKDKKPFTYTPGGIDLSEVRSPRMQRRIERNANLGGVSDVPRPPPPQNVGPLPPSALAAMRPQTQVQVFPGPPPAPPMQKNIPPPPPPPTCPLPTQKVQTGASEVLERPDMTKIIPENPMSLLRKTGGPTPRKSLVEQMYEAQPPSPERPQPISTPVPPQQQYQPQYQAAQPQYQAPQPQYQAPQPQYQAPQPQYQAPQPQYQAPQPQYQAPQSQFQQRSPESPKPSPYQPPIIERQATVPRQEPPQRNNVVSSNVGTLYIPPLNQQQQKVVSPPTPPERTQPQVQSPGTPTLKEAPRPWQQRNRQQELPAWAKKDEPPAPNMQQRWQPPAAGPAQQPRSPQPPNTYPVQIEVRTVPYQPDEVESIERKPNAVYVTQPVVLQHPGTKIEPPYQGSQPQQYQQQQTRQQVQQHQTRTVETGTRIIPIQIEGRTPPTTPGDRNLNRQLSWGSQPSQSNSFKVIQKFTRTDDEEDEDTPVTQHSARFNQEMPEQVRRMKINDNNGHFRQGSQQNNGGRNVPVEPPYVHPSEQVVPEPKKYMGSNIPSRSFKILQAMTAPAENCANANYNEELPYNVFNPYAYPYYPPPYWSDYYTNFYQSEQSDKNSEKASTKSGRSTPLPMPYPPQQYWHDFYPSNYPQEQSDSTSKMSDRSSKSSKSGRSTPLPPPMPFWGYMPPPRPKAENTLRPQTPKNEEPAYHCPPMYPPYYDPYYYSYYYGYPPMMPPFPYYHQTSENEEFNGYSSMDEMSNYNNSRRSSLRRRNSLDNNNNNNINNSVQTLRQHFEVRSKSATPRITITPTYSQENINVPQENIYNVPPDEAEDSDTEVEGSQPNGLRSIKSVQNINVYDASDTESEETSSEEAETDDIDDESIPHQLSVIYEESERGESRRSFRCSSAASETTTIAEHQSEEEDDDDFLANQNVKYKINLFQESNQGFTVTEKNNAKVFKEESFSLNAIERKSFGGAENRRIFTKAFESFERCEVGQQCFKVSSESSKRLDFEKLENKLFQMNDYCNSNSRVISVNKEESKSFDSFSCSSKNDVESGVTVEEVESEVEDNAEKLCIKEKEENCDKHKEKDEDWWGVIANDKQDNVKVEATECDNNEIKSKSDYVMVKVKDEVVTVKLRNKNVTKKLEIGKEEELFSQPTSTRNSVYDELNEDNQVVSGGTLMRVDSFASQLEALKRNSGLWNLGDILSNKPENIIKEESVDTVDSESEQSEPEQSEPEQSEPEEQRLTNEEYTDDEQTINVAEQSSLCTEPREETANLSEESEIDFWSQIKNDDDDFQPRRRSYYLNEEENDDSNEPINDNTYEEKVDSANSRDSSCSKSPENNKASETESSEDEAEIRNSRSKSLEPQTIKERIEALRNSISNKQQISTPDKEDLNILSVKNKISAIEVPTSKTTSTKSSMKSFDEYSEEEELDSGVISDISRHISDNEEFPELKKMTRYERAATHSRLFKLLQDECEIEEQEEATDKFSKLSVRQVKQSRSKLSLNLNTDNVNEKLVEELVQSLLKSKKAHIFKNMPKEKLYAAAVTILQEGIDTNETPSEEFSSLLSPLRGDTATSTPAQTPQEFYNDNGYKQYYDSWSDAAVDIMPSKAFKLLQDHLGANKLGNIDGFMAKCPRILKLLDENSSDCSLSLNNPESNDVTNT